MITYSVLKLTKEEKERLIEEIDRKIVEIAKAKGLGMDIATRELRPTDILDTTAEVWSESLGTANAWNRVTPAEGKKIEEKVIAIYGVKSVATNPLTVGVRFTRGRGRDIDTIAEFFFEEMYADEVPERIFSKVVYYEKDEYANVYQYARATGTDKLIFLGRVAEPASKIAGR